MRNFIAAPRRSRTTACVADGDDQESGERRHPCRRQLLRDGGWAVIQLKQFDGLLLARVDVVLLHIEGAYAGTEIFERAAHATCAFQVAFPRSRHETRPTAREFDYRPISQIKMRRVADQVEQCFDDTIASEHFAICGHDIARSIGNDYGRTVIDAYDTSGWTRLRAGEFVRADVSLARTN